MLTILHIEGVNYIVTMIINSFSCFFLQTVNINDNTCTETGAKALADVSCISSHF